MGGSENWLPPHIHKPAPTKKPPNPSTNRRCEGVCATQTKPRCSPTGRGRWRGDGGCLPGRRWQPPGAAAARVAPPRPTARQPWSAASKATATGGAPGTVTDPGCCEPQGAALMWSAPNQRPTVVVSAPGQRPWSANRWPAAAPAMTLEHLTPAAQHPVSSPPPRCQFDAIAENP